MSTQGRHHAGFTLIEVMLFLAITGLLFLIGFFGTTFQIRNVRFTDSMRSLHSNLQKQYTLVATGANPRDVSATCTNPGGALGTPPTFGTGTAAANDTAGDAGGCVLLGKLVKLSPDNSNLTSYYVVGTRLSASQLTGDDVTDLRNSGPALSPQAIDSQEITWGANFIQPSSAASNNQSQAFAYLRSPSTGRIMTFAFSNDVITNGTIPGNDAAMRSAITTANLAVNAGYCFKGTSGNQAIIKLGYDKRGDALDLAFDGFNTNTDCVRTK